MKRNIPRLVLVCFIFYFLIDPLRQILLKGFTPFSSLDVGAITLYLTISTFFCFFIFSASAYLGFLYFFKKRQWVYIVLTMAAGMIIGSCLRYFFQQLLSDWLFNFVNYRRDIPISYFFKDQLYFAIIYFTVGIVYFNIQYGTYKDKREKELVLNNQKMELSLLRSQINPHFLLNSMNNIYSLVHMNSEKALPAIDTLSSILKYTLYENKEMVTLKEECDYLNNYIDLQSLRYSHKPAIQMDFPSSTLSKEVPQFILVPLIENAFKHGDLRNEENPLLVQSKEKGNQLELYISNAIGNQKKDEIGGIGLDNVQKRLNLLYGENHTFDIKNDGKTFSIKINFPIQ